MQIYLHSQSRNICECRNICIHKSRRSIEIRACRYFCIHTSVIFVNAEIAAFTIIHILSRFVNADISACSALTRYEFNKIILSKLHYTCIFNRLNFKGYYDAYDSTFYGRLFLIYLGKPIKNSHIALEHV